jgi:hypothetical protein
MLAIIVIVVIVIAGLAVTYPVWGIHPMSTPNTAGNRTLLHGTAIVGSPFYYIQFIVPAHAFNIHVTGNYSVRGNSTIRLYVMNESAFESWNNLGSQISADFDSGQSSEGLVNATLSGSGVYYVFFENKEGLKEAVVDTDLNLSYWLT